MSYLSRFENCLLPPPEIIYWNQNDVWSHPCSTSQKVAHYVKNILFLVVTPFLFLFTAKNRPVIPEIIETTGANEQNNHWPPENRGFAQSFFQTSGIGTKWGAPRLKGRNEWDNWLDDPSHLCHVDKVPYESFFIDILSNPDSYIQMLKESNVTALRFSLEWAVLEPQFSSFDHKAIQLYTNFIDKLIDAKITPSVTLHHFTVPQWFYEQGDFQHLPNRQAYLYFSLWAIATFPKVDHWWSFNEIAIKAFQQARKAFPPNIAENSSFSQRVHAAGIVTRNMLLTHCLLHQKVAKQYPAKTLGITHQWLKFETANNNWLERLVAHYFTRFAFTPVYDFFKTGHYRFQFPFVANIQFIISPETFKAHNHFLMHLGVQAYPKPLIKMGRNNGKPYPGLPSAIKNFPFFSFGASCNPEGHVTSLGPCGDEPEAIYRYLDEAFALTPRVSITEFGHDANIQKWGSAHFAVNRPLQAAYIERFIDAVKRYCTTREVKLDSIFAWSDLSRLEWERGVDECKLALVEPTLNENRQLIDWTLTTAANYLKDSLFSKIH